MHKFSLARVVVLGSTIALVSLGAAHAEDQSAADAAAEAKMMNGAKISVAEAAASAESKLGGKAVDIGLEASIGTLLYQVTLLNPDGTEVEATVDAMTGETAKAVETRDDNGDQADENGGGNHGEHGGETQDGGSDAAESN